MASPSSEASPRRTRLPSSRPCGRAIGRWQLSFDGWRGELDLYHLPGMSDPWFEDMGFVNVDDRRLGTFYDAAGNAFKVNGQVFFNFVESTSTPTTRPLSGVTSAGSVSTTC